MKKISTLLCSCCLLFSTAIAQTPYYDALTARKLVTIDNDTLKFKADPTSIATLLSILKTYLPDSVNNDPDLTDARVFEKYLNNPFFGVKLIRFKKGGAGLDAAGLFGSILGAAGNLDVTKIADGFARFLVKRTKEELNVAF